MKVQQILLKVASPALDAQVEQKAKDLIAKLRGNGSTATKEAFAEVAKGNSEDPATAKNGGFLTSTLKKNPNKVDALYERAIDMQPGTYPIFRSSTAVIGTSCDATKLYRKLSRKRNRNCWFRCATPALMASRPSSAERAQARLKETKDPQAVAKELAAEANMQTSEMVKETGYIKPGDDVTDIGSNQQFEQAIAGLNNPNDVGERTGVKGGFAIPMFIDKKDPPDPGV